MNLEQIIQKIGEGVKFNGKVYGSAKNGYSIYLDGEKISLSEDGKAKLEESMKSKKAFIQKLKYCISVFFQIALDTPYFSREKVGNYKPVTLATEGLNELFGTPYETYFNEAFFSIKEKIVDYFEWDEDDFEDFGSAELHGCPLEVGLKLWKELGMKIKSGAYSKVVIDEIEGGYDNLPTIRTQKVFFIADFLLEKFGEN